MKDSSDAPEKALKSNITDGNGDGAIQAASLESWKQTVEEKPKANSERLEAKEAFRQFISNNPDQLWAKDLDARVIEAVTEFNEGKTLENGLHYGDAAKKVRLEGMSAKDLETQLLKLGFEKHADYIRLPNNPQQELEVDGKKIRMDVYTHADGSMVRVKPDGHPGKARPQPHASISVRIPAHGNYRDFQQEGFKIGIDGRALPKWPKDLYNPYESGTPMSIKYLDAWGDNAHTNLE